MNAELELDRLLKERAVLVRQNKHLVYRLPNGQSFVVAKTSSDPVRAARNSLSDLRRALGIERGNHRGKEEPPSMETTQLVLPPAERAPAPASLPEQRDSLQKRIEAAIAGEETQLEKVMAEAQQIERRVQMLRALLPFADDPAAEGALRSVLPSMQTPPSPPPAARPEPPQRITERVQVTRQLVLAATQTFDGPFTVNDVLHLMAGERQIDALERTRIRTSIAQAMVSLYERGELIREAEGKGRQQAIWRKADLNGQGTRA